MGDTLRPCVRQRETRPTSRPLSVHVTVHGKHSQHKPFALPSPYLHIPAWCPALRHSSTQPPAPAAHLRQGMSGAKDSQRQQSPGSVLFGAAHSPMLVRPAATEHAWSQPAGAQPEHASAACGPTPTSVLQRCHLPHVGTGSNADATKAMVLPPNVPSGRAARPGLWLHDDPLSTAIVRFADQGSHVMPASPLRLQKMRAEPTSPCSINS